MIVDLAYFRYFPGDHLKAKIGMSHEQKGIYGDLLDISWLQDPPGTLPTDHAEIARLVGIPLKRFATHVPIVLKAWKRQGKRLVHEWMEREYAKNLAYHTERSETGKKGVEAKRNKKLSLSSASAKLKPPSPSSSSHELRIGDYSSNPGDLNESVQFNNGTNPEMTGG
ncbi:MAG: YdaU family protein, partial [Nitrospira sp.]|nr:YdaU family protein [Nitrospira sp.]